MVKVQERLLELNLKRLVIKVMAGIMLAHVVIMLVGTPGARAFDAAVRVPLILSVLIAFISTTWAACTSRAYKQLWRLIAVGMFFWLGGEIVYLAYVITLGAKNVPSPSLADVFSIAYLPIILGIMFSIARIRPPFDIEKKQFLANVAMAGLALLLLCFKFIIAPTWYSNQLGLSERIMFIATYPLLDWIVLVSLLSASYKLRGSRAEGWLILLISAFMFAVLGDVIYYLHDNHRNSFTLLALIPMALLIAASAIDEGTGAFIGTIKRSQIKIKGVSNVQALMKNKWRTLITPLLTVAVIPAVWVVSITNGHTGEIPALGAISALILFLLAYRSHLLISDNAVLLSKALSDNTTGLNNHRYFQEALERALIKSEKASKAVSLLVMDVDDFSEINKLYGHAAGDKALTIIGSTILSLMREADEACRLSGDEFAIILPRTSSERALSIADSVRKKVNTALAEVFPRITAGLTIGISTYPRLAKNKDELVHTADGALYWAKINGKNRSLVYDPEVVQALSAEERAKRTEEVALIDMVRSLANAVDARDQYTRQHSRRVSSLAAKLAQYIGLDEDSVHRIETAGILHDVGKIGIPDSILNKPGRLTDEEMQVIKDHPALSGQIIESTSLKEIVPAVRAHHERWDGKGYPDGLKGKEIPFEARIMALADTYDAMTTDRPYRKGLTPLEALEEIDRCAGSQFDPDLAESFLSMFCYKQGQEADDQQEEPVEDNCEVTTIAS